MIVNRIDPKVKFEKTLTVKKLLNSENMNLSLKIEKKVYILISIFKISFKN